MTTNQRRAAALAEGIARGALNPQALSDSDWSLLLLAAGTNAVAAPPAQVVRRVLERARRDSDYFRRGPARAGEKKSRGWASAAMGSQLWG